MARLGDRVRQVFTERFGDAPSALVRAPGRVNLIGEHTDYNDGFVLPIAIDRAVWFAVRPRDDGRVRVYSLDYDQETRFGLASFEKTSDAWDEYLKGTAWALQQAGHTLRGFDGVLSGDVPHGAGLSSSAALELATARVFAHLSSIDWHPATMARLAQQAENDWVGVNCGIMDQLASAAGREGHALLIDCRNLETEAVPLPSNTAVVVLDTGTRRGLVGSAYNDRRQQCDQAAEALDVQALRDVTVEALEQHADTLPALTYRRARHVVGENRRVLEATDAMRRHDPVTLGKLMDASHDSLRDDFEVSSDALNIMVTCAQQQPGCYGARMTGAGFGGCAVALVDVDAVDAFTEAVVSAYKEKSDNDPEVYVCHASDGADVVSS
ncbi:MAG: galactokinase [Trueperaceae bacterium]|nr:galactokinase [Trueperaceae bacterium]